MPYGGRIGPQDPPTSVLHVRIRNTPSLPPSSATTVKKLSRLCPGGGTPRALRQAASYQTDK
jgi:hypothetical protein